MSRVNVALMVEIMDLLTIKTPKLNVVFTGVYRVNGDTVSHDGIFDPAL
jgi:hypothetical protein